jgi:hypothetical protein
MNLVVSRDSNAQPNGYTIKGLAEKHGITLPQAQQLIFKFGNDRQKLDEAARRLIANA